MLIYAKLCENILIYAKLCEHFAILIMYAKVDTILQEISLLMLIFAKPCKVKLIINNIKSEFRKRKFRFNCFFT